MGYAGQELLLLGWGLTRWKTQMWRNQGLGTEELAILEPIVVRTVLAGGHSPRIRASQHSKERRGTPGPGSITGKRGYQGGTSHCVGTDEGEKSQGLHRSVLSPGLEHCCRVSPVATTGPTWLGPVPSAGVSPQLHKVSGLPQGLPILQNTTPPSWMCSRLAA